MKINVQNNSSMLKKASGCCFLGGEVKENFKSIKGCVSDSESGLAGLQTPVFTLFIGAVLGF